MSVSAGDRQKAINLLEMASHENANGHEALNALRALTAMRVRVGSFEELFRDNRPTAVVPHMSFNETRRQQSEFKERIETLERDKANLEKEVNRLAVENGKLVASNATLKVASTKGTAEDGSMDYMSFATTLQRVLGKNWRGEFSRQTGIEQRIVERQRQRGSVDKALVDLIPTLQSDRTDWFTPQQVNKVIRPALAKGSSYVDVAKLLSVGDRIYTAEMLTKLRSDMRNKRGPYGDRVYGEPIPTPWREVVTTRATTERETITRIVEAGGAAGVLKKVLRAQVTVNDFSVRMRDLERRDVLFRVGERYVSATHKAHHPVEWAAHREDIDKGDGVDWKTFKKAVCHKLEREYTETGKNGWQTEFERQTKTAHHTVQRWQTINHVPDYAMRSVDDLVRSPTESVANINWSADMKAYLWSMARGKKVTNVEMELEMKKRYPGVNFGFGSIAGMVTRLRREHQRIS